MIPSKAPFWPCNQLPEKFKGNIMGTRSATYIQGRYSRDEPFGSIVTILRQEDGDPACHGQDIKNILGNKQVVNGLNDRKRQINGPHCAAAMLVAGLKNGAGGIYLHRPDTEYGGMDYIYTVYIDVGSIDLVIRHGWDAAPVLYSGPLDEFDPKTLKEKYE